MVRVAFDDEWEPGTGDPPVSSWRNAAPTVEGIPGRSEATTVAWLNEQRSLIVDLLRLA